MRCFAAIPVPEEPADKLMSWRAGPAKELAGVRWVGRDALHLTLKFFGDVPGRSIPKLADSIAAATAGCRSFHMELKGLGRFPPRGPARVIWAGVGAGSDELKLLARRIEAASDTLAPAGGEGGSRGRRRPFRPHVTLGRIRRPGETDGAVKELVDGGDEPIWGRWRVASFSLFHSRLTPRGPVYRILDTFHLR